MKLYNTLSRSLEEFEPLEEKKVGIYTCGPTVYREIHIGNLRTYTTSDILKRVLKANGYEVTAVMNITDVGHFRYSQAAGKVIDPVMEEAKQFGVTPLDIAAKYTDIFLNDAKKLHIEKPDIMPKASEHIPEMIEIIKILIDKKLAYITDGNVYFKVKNFKDYGKLSGNTLDKMDQLLEAVRVSVETDKKDSADFALWKKAAADQVMKWESPWGMGVPGWHIECSAMSIRYLGDSFDIHAGGEDLIFPHHEDEIAQSEGATEKSFVKYWVHSNWLLVDGEKMSRSKGNVYTLRDIIEKKFSPLAFRFLTFQTHYRARLNFTWESLEASQTALDKLFEQAHALPTSLQDNVISDYYDDFFQAISHDLDIPKAISIMWSMLRSDHPAAQKLTTLYKMDEILGLGIQENVSLMAVVPQEVMEMAKQRDDLRKARKFAQADQMRAKIEKKGFIVKDNKKKSQVFRKI